MQSQFALLLIAFRFLPYLFHVVCLWVGGESHQMNKIVVILTDIAALDIPRVEVVVELTANILDKPLGALLAKSAVVGVGTFG